MRKSMFCILVVILFIAQFWVTPEVSGKPPDSIIGTWKAVGYVDSTGKNIDYPKEAVRYTTILENGVYFQVRFGPELPQLDRKPETLEEFQKIAANSWSQLGSCNIDYEKNTMSGKYLYSTWPAEIGYEFTIEFK